MIKKKAFALILLVFLIPLVYGGVSAPSFFVYIGNGGSLGFQTPVIGGEEVKLTVSSGNINSSSGFLSYDRNRGLFIFVSNESVTFTLTFNVSRVQVNGVLSTSGNSYNYVQNNTVRIEWWNIIQPWIPYMFILGMIGLGSMFAGPIVAIKQIKENPQQALTMGVTLTALGIGLFMAWLGSG